MAQDRNDSDRLRDGFAFRLVRIAQRWRREIDTELRAFGLTEATWRPLLHLWRGGHRMPAKDLAASVGIEEPALTPLLESLETQGLVTRAAACEPSGLVIMTEDGLELADGVQSVVEDVRRRLLAGILDDEIETCLRLFDRIDRAFREKEFPREQSGEEWQR
jgi:MarR family transcriptional regulator for hemolysin